MQLTKGFEMYQDTRHRCVVVSTSVSYSGKFRVGISARRTAAQTEAFRDLPQLHQKHYAPLSIIHNHKAILRYITYADDKTPLD